MWKNSFLLKTGGVGGLLGEDFWERGVGGSNYRKIVSFQGGTGRADSDGRLRFFEKMVVFWVKNGRKTRKRGGKSDEKREKVWFPDQVLKNGRKRAHRSS